MDRRGRRPDLLDFVQVARNMVEREGLLRRRWRLTLRAVASLQ